MTLLFCRTARPLKGLVAILCIGLFSLFFLSLVGCNCDTGLNIEPGVLQTNLPGEQKPTLLFSDAVVGQENIKRFRIFNSGQKPLSIKEISITGKDKAHFTVTHPQLPLELQPGEDRGINATVNFKPPHEGLFEARLELTSPEAKNVSNDKLFFIRLYNTQLQPSLGIDCPELIDFSVIPLGTFREKTCTIVNQGDAPLEIRKIEDNIFRGSKTAFSWSIKPSLPIKLRPRSTDKLVVKIRFQPQIPPYINNHLNLLFYTNVLGPRKVFQLGIKGQVKVAELKLIPIFPPCISDDHCRRHSSVMRCMPDGLGTNRCQFASGAPSRTFPMTAVGKTTHERFWIRSLSPFPIRLTGFELKNKDTGFRVDTKALPYTLQPKQQLEVKVYLSPKKKGQEKNIIIVRSVPESIPQQIFYLYTSSYGCALEPDKQKVHFEQEGVKRLYLTNKGNQSCFIDQIGLENKPHEPYSIFKEHAFPTRINPGRTLSVRIDFFSSKKGSKTDNAIVIQSNDSDQPEMKVPLSGVLPCKLQSIAVPIQFPSTTPGIAHKKTITFTVSPASGVCHFDHQFSITSQGINRGEKSLTITKMPALPFKIEPGKSFQMELTFKAKKANTRYSHYMNIKPRTGRSIFISFDTLTQNHCVQISPPILRFPDGKLNCPTKKNLLTINHSNANGCPFSVRLTKLNCLRCAPNPQADFKYTPVKLPFDLRVGQPLQMAFAFKARIQGDSSTTVNLEHSFATQSPQSFQLKGTGSPNEGKETFTQSGTGDTFVLKALPASGSVQVLVNGSVVAGWTYQKALNSVVFKPGSIPKKGSTVTITYKYPCEPW